MLFRDVPESIDVRMKVIPPIVLEYDRLGGDSVMMWTGIQYDGLGES